MATLRDYITQTFGNLASGQRLQKQGQLYSQLGGTGNYTGNLQQNMFLLNNRTKWGQNTPTQAQNTVSPQAQQSSNPYLSAIQKTPVRTADQFKKMANFGMYFDPGRTVEAQRARVDAYVLPELQKSISAQRRDLAGRNLLRSGIRNREETDINTNAAEKYDQMLQDLVNVRFGEATKNYETDLARFLEDKTTPAENFQFNTPQVTQPEYNLSEPTGDLSRFGAGFTNLRKRSRDFSFDIPEYLK